MKGLLVALSVITSVFYLQDELVNLLLKLISISDK
jgi:hypothetical protein